MSGSGAIVISANNVTLDLNGFALSGDRVAISNGFLEEWSHAAIDSDREETAVTNVNVTRCRLFGILVGAHARVRDCRVSFVQAFGVAGIQTLTYGRVENCEVRRCTNGIVVDTASLVADCVVSDATDAMHNGSAKNWGGLAGTVRHIRFQID